LENKNYSEETAKNIDAEVNRLVKEAYDNAKNLLTKNRKNLDLIAQLLIEKEVLDIYETRKLLGMEQPVTDQEDQTKPASQEQEDAEGTPPESSPGPSVEGQ